MADVTRIDGPADVEVTIPQRPACKSCGGAATVTLFVGVSSYSVHEGFACAPDCEGDADDIEF